MLTAFFELKQTDTEARQHLYKDILKFYTWNKSTRKWNRQKQGKMRGRMVSANLAEGERFYLRVILQHVKGPTGFDYLYTVTDVLYTTFCRAALERVLIKTDDYMHACLPKLIIWDEALMAKRQVVEAVDRTMQDITGVKLPFGGKIFVLGGDFRQVLPVIRRGT
nr:hypothetical protein [Tanacetum cinerariifolium]